MPTLTIDSKPGSFQTPILIPEEKFPSWGLVLLRADPLTYIVREYREILLGSKLPSLKDLGSTTLFALAAFICGGLVFRYMKRGFADVL